MIKDIKIDTNNCIGCGNCEKTCPAAFRLSYKVHATTKPSDYLHHSRKIIDAYNGCPVNSIELVSDDPSLRTVWYPAEVAEKTMLSESVMELSLKAAINGTYKPGQYVTVRFKDDVGSFNRAYSIVDYKNGMMTLCVTLLKEGRGSSFFANYSVGSAVEITDPKGAFGVCDTENPKVFIATGTGLAALLSMVESRPDVKKTLYFGQRTENELFYRERLGKIPNLDVHYCLDFPEDEWTGPRGRVTEHFLSYPLTKDTEIYTCGSDAMMNDLEKTLKKKRHPKNHFFRESFSPLQATDLSAGNLLFRIWMRNIHVYISLAMCMLFLFFGLTGFMANRPDLFQVDSLEKLPANIALEKGEMGGFFKGKFGAGYSVADYSKEDGYISISLSKDQHSRYAVEVSEEERTYTVAQTMPLPAGADAMDEQALARAVAESLPGHLDEQSIEADGDTIYLNLESVWLKCSVTVDRTNNEYQINRGTIPWVKSLVLLHKGKMAGTGHRTGHDHPRGRHLIHRRRGPR
jgi:ferredoxin-NADP reductase/ferredoxin